MTTHLWASPPFTHTNNTDTSGLAQSLPGCNPGRGRCAPRVRAVRRRNAVPTDTVDAETSGLAASRAASESGKCPPGEAPSCGGWGREGVRSEARAEQRLAPGGRAALPLTRTKHWRAALPLT